MSDGDFFDVDDDDRPIQLPKRPLQEADMDITPMIDITFLLLIFFLVASRMDADIQVSLPPARHGTAVATKNSVILTVAQGTGGQARIYKGDGAIHRCSWRARIQPTRKRRLSIMCKPRWTVAKKTSW